MKRDHIGDVNEMVLEPCPMPNCGRDVEASEEGVFCICGYRLDDELEDMEDEPGVTTIQRHNALSREARVGRLVEKIFFGRTDFEAGRMLLVAESEGSAVAGMTAAVSIWKEEYGHTLLAALEALAAALEVKDVWLWAGSSSDRLEVRCSGRSGGRRKS